MIYYAHFTLLINGATWGTHEEEFEAETIEELFEMIKEWNEENDSQKEEYLLDYVENEEGEEVNEDYFEWLIEKRKKEH